MEKQETFDALQAKHIADLTDTELDELLYLMAIHISESRKRLHSLAKEALSRDPANPLATAYANTYGVPLEKASSS